MKSISVLIADDHGMVREAFGQWLRRQKGIEIVGAVGNAEEAVRVARERKPDVVVLDIDMPGLDCFDGARKILKDQPDVHIIFFSGFLSDGYIEQVLALKASGYVSKAEGPSAMVAAIRAAVAGSVYFSPDIQARIVIDTDGLRAANSGRTLLTTLSARELQVLRYVAAGLSKRVIAETMYLSAKTIDRHTANVMTKLKIHDRVELARFAIREGLTNV